MNKLLKHYVEPHKNISRECIDKDIETIKQDAELMYELCCLPRGKWKGALALAHQQINDKKPLRFYVTFDKKIYINPVIINHTKTFVDSKEGCLSFPDREQIIVNRYNKCLVKYQVIDADGDLSDYLEENFVGKDSKVLQHEIDHFECRYIYE